MYVIKKENVVFAEKHEIKNSFEGYEYPFKLPVVQISYDNEGINVFFTVFEKNPRCVNTAHFMPVNEDSCVEFFANFTPDSVDRYINFEVNALGMMNASFRKDRYDSVYLTLDEIKGFNITPTIYSDYWTLSYKIGFDFIKKYYPDFRISAGTVFKGNIYKCGDCTEYEHYIMYFDLKTEEPDFHRPEFFGDFVME